MFNVPPTAKVTWRRDHSIRVSSDILDKHGDKLWIPRTRQVVKLLHHVGYYVMEGSLIKFFTVFYLFSLSATCVQTG